MKLLNRNVAMHSYPCQDPRAGAGGPAASAAHCSIADGQGLTNYTTIRDSMRSGQKFHLNAQAVFQAEFRLGQLFIQRMSGEHREIDVATAMRLDGHSMALHLSNSRPIEITGLPNGCRIEDRKSTRLNSS